MVVYDYSNLFFSSLPFSHHGYFYSLSNQLNPLDDQKNSLLVHYLCSFLFWTSIVSLHFFTTGTCLVTLVLSPLNAIMAKTAKLYQTRGLTDGGIFAFLIHNPVVMEIRGLVLVQFRQVQIDATAFDRTQANFI